MLFLCEGKFCVRGNLGKGHVSYDAVEVSAREWNAPGQKMVRGCEGLHRGLRAPPSGAAPRPAADRGPCLCLLVPVMAG